MNDFRKAMSNLHTWAGLVCGAGLFAVFWMGALSVFDREIDLWMKPEIRVTNLDVGSLDLLQPTMDRLAETTPQFVLFLPKEREPTVRIGYTDAEGEWQVLHFEPSTATEVIPTDSLAGTRFIFPFHFSFHISWMNLGYWIVAFLAMAMMVLIVSGLFTHRKIIADFFTFRPRKNLRRSTLDFHNLTALIALPFHFTMPFTGLVIFFSFYLPWSIAVPFKGDTAPLFADMFGTRSAIVSGEAAPSISLDEIVSKANLVFRSKYGEAAQTDRLLIDQWGDAGGEITARRVFPAREVTMNRDAITFSMDGLQVSELSTGPIRNAHAWLSGLHFIQFDDWILRWLYFLAGLCGCAMIGSGLLFWIRARTRKNLAEPIKVRTVRALVIGASTGLILATGAFFVSNRLLGNGASLGSWTRAELEIWAFAIVWVGAFAHAAMREERAWFEQSIAIAAVALFAVFLNWFTTRDHLIHTIETGLWSVAGMDLMLMTSAAVAVICAHQLRITRAKTEA